MEKIFKAVEKETQIASTLYDKQPLYANSPTNPCYDCGSTIPRHHTPDCEFGMRGDEYDLPAREGSQHWTGGQN